MGQGYSALHEASAKGDIGALRVAVQEHGSQLDSTEPSRGWTALHIAADKGFDVIVRELLARGAAPNLVDKEGQTALHLAAAGGHTPVVRDLLRKGADPARRNQAGRSPLDLALEKQAGAAAALLAEALANRGLPASTTPTGSPTAWQAQQQQQQQQQQQPEQLRSNLGALNLNSPAPGGAGRAAAGTAGSGGLGSYPIVPAPSTDGSWLSGLPVPPGVSLNLPSAPPAPGPDSQQQQQLPDYYDYLVPSAVTATAPGAPPLAAGSGGTAAPFSPYPAVPSAAPAGAPAAPALTAYPQQAQAPYQQQQQQYQPQQQQYQLQPQQAPQQYQQQQQQQPAEDWIGGLPAPPAVPPPAAPAAARPAAAAAAGEDDDDDDDWGAAGDDDWGGEPSGSSAAGGGAGGPRSRPQQGPDLNALVSGAGKVAGAVASTAVSGAKNFLAGLVPRPPPGKRDGQAAGPDSPGARLAAAASAATTAGPAGRLYSYDDLARATQGFSAANRLGAGGYGPVFRGRLDGVPVAVKLLDAGEGSQQGVAEFQAEVAILSRLHHPHIVLLMGSCPERCALVYELLDNGNLEQHLLGRGTPDLAWQDRIRIACEVVSALLFLHSAPEPIIHMDLKPANLLLNKSLVCKVADVGLSRLMPLVSASGGPGGPMSTVQDTRLVGTPRYIDPEYLRTGRFGPKSDTFSLGVILLQMLTGLEATKVITVVEAAIARSQGVEGPASFVSITDPRAGSWPITEAACFAHLALRCVELQRQKRPDLRSEVLPALLQLAERARLFAGQGGSVRRSNSLGGRNQPPSMFICPITQDVMDDPVFAADGYTYEREAIAGWMVGHNTSPMTNLSLPHNGLTPNLALRSGIREWQEKHGAL